MTLAASCIPHLANPSASPILSGAQLGEPRVPVGHFKIKEKLTAIGGDMSSHRSRGHAWMIINDPQHLHARLSLSERHLQMKGELLSTLPLLSSVSETSLIGISTPQKILNLPPLPHEHPTRRLCPPTPPPQISPPTLSLFRIAIAQWPPPHFPPAPEQKQKKSKRPPRFVKWASS